MRLPILLHEMHSSYLLDKLNRVALHMGPEIPRKEALIQSLKRVGAVQVEGDTLNYHLGKLLSFPQLLRSILEMLFLELEEKEFDLLLGSAFETSLYASYLSLEKLIPQIAITPEGKVEGDFFAGQHALLIEGVIDHPIRILHAMERLSSEKIAIAHIVGLIDAEEGAVELLRKGGCSVQTLFKASDFLEKC